MLYKVRVLTFESMDAILKYGRYIQMKAVAHYFPVVLFIMLHVAQGGSHVMFKSVDA